MQGFQWGKGKKNAWIFPQCVDSQSIMAEIEAGWEIQTANILSRRKRDLEIVDMYSKHLILCE